MKKLLLIALGMIIFATPLLSFERHQAVFFYDLNYAYKQGKIVPIQNPPVIFNNTVYMPLEEVKKLTGTTIGHFENGFFLDHIDRDKPEIYFDDDALDPLLKLIKNATTSIDIQMFSFTNEDVISALNTASKKESIIVRLFFRDTKENRESASKLDQTSNNHIQIKYTKRYLHRKLAVFDKAKVWIGSTNWSGRGFESNTEVDASIWDPELANEVLLTFNFDWEYPDGKPKESSGEITEGCKYVYSSKGKKFHISTCSYAKKILDPKCFDTKEEAIKRGYEACSRCNP